MRLVKRERIGSILMLAVIGLALAFHITYSGPYRWLADSQLKEWGYYYPKLTYVAVLLLIGIPVGIAWLIIDRRFPARPTPDYQQRSNPGWKRVPVGGALLGVVFAGTGIYMAARGWNVGELTAVKASAFQSDTFPGSRYIDVSGRLLINAAVVMQEGDRGSKTAYVPLVADDWHEGEPVVLVIEASESRIDAAASEASWRGVWSHDALPGDVRTLLQSSGVAVADRHAVLELGQLPTTGRNVGLTFVGAGSLMLLISGIIWARRGGYWRPETEAERHA